MSKHYIVFFVIEKKSDYFICEKGKRRIDEKKFDFMNF